MWPLRSNVLGNRLRRFSFASLNLTAKPKLRLKIFSLWLSLVPLVFAPSISWGGPWTVRFNSQVVDASNQSEVSSFSPIASPRISYYPILNSVLFSPTGDADIVILLNSASLVGEYSSCVVYQLLSNSNSAGNWPPLIDLVFHGFFSFDFSELVNFVNFSPLLSPASLAWHTVFALNLSCASNTVVMTVGLVWWAGLISYAVLMDPLVCVFSISSMTSEIWGLAGNQDLGC